MAGNVRVVEAIGVAAVRVQIPQDGVLATSDVDELIAALWRARRTMQPAIPATYPKGETEAVMSPLVAMPSHHADPVKGLGIRHPGLGWLIFVLDTTQAVQLGRYLLSTSPEQPHSPTSLN